ncbi:hypothetical protein Efla_000736 [Eimeria flavescens]
MALCASIAAAATRQQQQQQQQVRDAAKLSPQPLPLLLPPRAAAAAGMVCAAGAFQRQQQGAGGSAAARADAASRLPVVTQQTDEEQLAEAIAECNFPGDLCGFSLFLFLLLLQLLQLLLLSLLLLLVNCLLQQPLFARSFAWATAASPCGYARLCRSGFLPVAEAFEFAASPAASKQCILLLPKLHVERTCLLLRSPAGGAPASKHLKRKSSNFLLSVDQAFDQVLAGCIRRHGESWLWLPVRQCLRALHRRTLRAAALRLQADSSSSSRGCPLAVSAPVEDGTRKRRQPQQQHQQEQEQQHQGQEQEQQQQQQEEGAEDVELHSFEVWAPLSALNELKLLPLKTQVGGAAAAAAAAAAASAAAREAAGGAAAAAAALGASARIGEAHAAHKDFCLVAGELGVSVGRVYTSLTGFTDADSAGSVQMAATRLLLRAAGFELLDLGMHLPYKESLGARPLPRAVFLKLFRRCRDKAAAPIQAILLRCCAAAAAAAAAPAPAAAASAALKQHTHRQQQQEQHQQQQEQHQQQPQQREKQQLQQQQQQQEERASCATQPLEGKARGSRGGTRALQAAATATATAAAETKSKLMSSSCSSGIPPGFIPCRELLQMLSSKAITAADFTPKGDRHGAAPFSSSSSSSSSSSASSASPFSPSASSSCASSSSSPFSPSSQKQRQSKAAQGDT